MAAYLYLSGRVTEATARFFDHSENEVAHLRQEIATPNHTFPHIAAQPTMAQHSQGEPNVPTHMSRTGSRQRLSVLGSLCSVLGW